MRDLVTPPHPHPFPHIHFWISIYFIYIVTGRKKCQPGRSRKSMLIYKIIRCEETASYIPIPSRSLIVDKFLGLVYWWSINKWRLFGFFFLFFGLSKCWRKFSNPSNPLPALILIKKTMFHLYLLSDLFYISFIFFSDKNN